MELAALNVTIRTTGASQAEAALRGVEVAGQRAGKAVDAGAAHVSRSVANEVAALKRLGPAAQQASLVYSQYAAKVVLSSKAILLGQQTAIRAAVASGTKTAAEGARDLAVAMEEANQRIVAGIKTLEGRIRTLHAAGFDDLSPQLHDAAAGMVILGDATKGTSRHVQEAERASKRGTQALTEQAVAQKDVSRATATATAVGKEYTADLKSAAQASREAATEAKRLEQARAAFGRLSGRDAAVQSSTTARGRVAHEVNQLRGLAITARQASEQTSRLAVLQARLRGATSATGQSVAVLATRTRSMDGRFRDAARTMASVAATEIGLRSGLGSLGVVLGSFAITSSVLLGITAGLAAIALGFAKIRDRAREAREAAQKSLDALQQSAEAVRGMLSETLPLETAQAAQGAAQEQLDRATARVEQFERQRVEAVEAVADAERRLQAVQRTGVAPVAETVALSNARKRLTEATLAVQKSEIEQATAANNLRVARANLTKAEKEAAEERKRLADEAARMVRAEVEALAQLTAAGVATSDEMARLAAVQEQLERATKRGTLEARAQALALLEVVRAARLARLEGALRLDKLDPRTSKTSPPGSLFPRRATPLPTNEQLRERGFVPEFPTADVTAGFEKWFASLPTGVQNLELFRQEMQATADQMGSLPSILNAGAAAWLDFWEALGSGEGIGASVKKLFSGIARHFAQYYAAKALAAAAEALLPPPLGNPAAAKAIPALLAASAAFAALAGATGGGRSASTGGGGGGSLARERFMFEDHLQPRLRPGGTSPTAQTASQVRPVQPVVVHQTIIGPNDPVAQKQIAMLVTNAARRGYRTA